MNIDPHKVYIIIPVYNRCQTTLRCLKHLKTIAAVNYNIVIVDDNSTDGTAVAVKQELQSVHLLKGDGNLWWTGGIRMGMEYAITHHGDYMIWLNDDALPEKDSIEDLLALTSLTQGITGGIGISALDGKVLHGGRRKTRFGLVPLTNRTGIGVLAGDTVSGNLVCVHRRVVETIGYPDARTLPMGPGDFDYSLKAKQAHLPVLIDTNARVICEDNIAGANRSLLLSNIPLKTYWQQITRLNSSMHYRTKFIFYIRHWGKWGFFKYCIDYLWLMMLTLFRVCLPLPLRRVLYHLLFRQGYHERQRAEQIYRR